MPLTVAGLLAGGAAAAATAGLADAVSVVRQRGRRAAGGTVVRVVALAGRRVGMRAPRELAARIAAAGLDMPLADVVALKAGLALVGAAAAMPLVRSARCRTGRAG
jgi:hypothetical protein